MSYPEIAPSGKHVLYRRVDGQRIERWPVDARAILATGDYVTSPPDISPAPPAPRSIEGLPFDPESVPVRELGLALEKVADVATLDALEAADSRKSVSGTYAKRRAELDGKAPPAPEHPSGGPLVVSPADQDGPAAPIQG